MKAQLKKDRSSFGRRDVRNAILRWIEVIKLFWGNQEQIFVQYSREEVHEFRRPLQNQILPSQIAR